MATESKQLTADAIKWMVDKTRQLLTYTGRESNLRARITIAVTGTSDPLDHTPLAESILSDPELRKFSGLAAYERLRAQLVETAAQLAEAERAAQLSLDLYTVAVATGGDVESKQAELSAVRGRVEQLREQHTLLLAGAATARGVALGGLRELLGKRHTQHFAAATQRLDAVLGRVAEAIKNELPELAAAKAQWQAAGRQEANVDRLIPGLPAPPVTQAESEPDNNLVGQYGGVQPMIPSGY